MILGICGSGRSQGETAKMVRTVLEHTGEESEFLSLGSLRIEGCRGCLKCADGSGTCLIKDDFQKVVDRIRDARAVVIGFPDYSGFMNARTHALFERFYSLRHGMYHLGGKYIVPLTPGNPGSPGMEWAARQIKQNRLVELHRVFGECSAAPCFDCGHGHDCYAGHAMGKDGDPFPAEETEEHRTRSFEKSLVTEKRCRAAGWIIQRALKSRDPQD